jgi:hypothetical protein
MRTMPNAIPLPPNGINSRAQTKPSQNRFQALALPILHPYSNDVFPVIRRKTNEASVQHRFPNTTTKATLKEEMISTPKKLKSKYLSARNKRIS